MSRPLGQIALALFQNPKALAAMGAHLWKATSASGEAMVGTVRPRTGNEIYSVYLRSDS